MRASSLSYNTIAVNREIDSAYDAVLEVRDNLTNIAIVAGLDIDTILADLQDAKDFTGIKVAVGSVASWDSATKTITVPTVKGDTGDKGDNGVDGVQGPVGETGPRGLQGIQGNKGDKGDKGNVGPEGQQGLTGNIGPKGDTGVGVHHSRATSTTNTEGNFSVSGEIDTYTMYGDAAETIVLGEFSVSNGSSAYTYAVSAGYTGTSTQFYSELAAVRIYSEQAQLNANSAAASASQAVITAGQATTVASASSSSASAASASAAAALVSETNANTSKNTAATSATTATTKASEASTSASAASTSASNALSSATSAATSASTATTKASEASASVVTATTKASEASVSSSTSTTKASEASASAATTLGYKNDVSAMKLAIETIYDTFDDRFLGTKTTNPLVDNDGNALIDGAMYYNTSSNAMKVYDVGTTTWYAIPQVYLSALLDVQLTSITSGNILRWNGTKWINYALSKADVGLNLADNTADNTKNVLSATKLTTARTINGVSFDGTANITVTANANLAGNLLKAVPANAIFTDTIYDDSTTTKQGNSFNGISQLVKTDASGKLPAIDGSLLTNLASSGVSINDTVISTTTTYSSSKIEYLLNLKVSEPVVIIQINSTLTPTTVNNCAIYFTEFDVGTTIDWGDGATTTVTAIGNYSHTYSVGGIYDITLTGGGAIHLGVGSGNTSTSFTNSYHILKVTFGDFNFTNMESMFRQVMSNFVFNGTPSLSNVTNMGSMLYSSAFNQNISSWNVSNVTNMGSMFRSSAFNQNISSWNVSNVTNMFYMFYFASAFNQNISSWNVSNVISCSNFRASSALTCANTPALPTSCTSC